MRKIALGIFITVIIHVGFWFFLEMFKSNGEVLRNLFLLIISFLIWVLSISGYVKMTAKKIKNNN